MNLSDVLKVQITDEMIENAKLDATHLKSSIGQKTRAATEDRDIIGSLAHQAVENKFLEMGRPFTSTRCVRLNTGDDGDIYYDQDKIDVKGTHGNLDERYFYNKQFLVFDKELPAIEQKGITHFVFVLVDLPNREAYIFGAIDYNDFTEKSVPVTLQWENHAIKAFQLKPFISYVNRSN